ncbi:hypothetical protein BpHYR1_017227 [Brachionus plicatilis]|uniref:Transmembrane protein n=1 Tax=Brachionus plicatilis TaxID=10195 RepID=A0A3M7QRB6_BRAPC|nr:hypothetical protein BpHYR1_017227 [Brachionus plicatilis]
MAEAEQIPPSHPKRFFFQDPKLSLFILGTNCSSSLISLHFFNNVIRIDKSVLVSIHFGIIFINVILCVQNIVAQIHPQLLIGLSKPILYQIKKSSTILFVIAFQALRLFLQLAQIKVYI